MKKTLLFLSALAVLIMSAAVFAGCGGKNKDEVWDKKEGKIAVGFNADARSVRRGKSVRIIDHNRRRTVYDSQRVRRGSNPAEII